MPTAEPSRRRAMRRAVRLECRVQSELWDGELPFLATDLSPLGMWLDSPLPLEPDERVVVAFRPPQWPRTAPPLTAEARVARAGLHRRRADSPRESGMGLCFAGMDEVMRAALADGLRGLPPRLPGAVAPPLRLSLPPSELTIELDDGLRLELCAEAPLLTAGWPVAQLAPARRPARTSYRYVPREQRLGVPTPPPPAHASPSPPPSLRLVKG